MGDWSSVYESNSQGSLRMPCFPNEQSGNIWFLREPRGCLSLIIDESRKPSLCRLDNGDWLKLTQTVDASSCAWCGCRGWTGWVAGSWGGSGWVIRGGSRSGWVRGCWSWAGWVRGCWGWSWFIRGANSYITLLQIRLSLPLIQTWQISMCCMRRWWGQQYKGSPFGFCKGSDILQ